MKDSRKSEIPWKPILKNVGTVGTGFLLGSLASGVLSHAAAGTPEASWYWSRMSAKNKRRAATLMGGAAGALTPLAALAMHAGTQTALHHDTQRERREQDKVASVMRVYRQALEGLE